MRHKLQDNPIVSIYCYGCNKNEYVTERESDDIGEMVFWILCDWCFFNITEYDKVQIYIKYLYTYNFTKMNGIDMIKAIKDYFLTSAHLKMQYIETYPESDAPDLTSEETHESEKHLQEK